MVKVYIGKDSKGIDGLKLSEFDHLLIEWSVYDENFNIVKYLQNIRGRNTKQGGKQKMNEIIRKADTDLLWALLSDVTAPHLQGG